MPSEKDRKYNSRFSPDKKISGFQFILEVLCENKAASQDKELPLHFWTIPKWEKYFKSQMRALKKYCDKYGQAKVLKFVWEKNIYSLFAKWIDEALSNFEYKEVEEFTVEEIVRNSTICKQEEKKDTKVKNILDMLKKYE